MTDDPTGPARPDDKAAGTTGKPDPFAGFSIDFGGGTAAPFRVTPATTGEAGGET